LKWKNIITKQTGKKIKVLQIDSAGEYKDQSLRFSQNTGIGIHFTNEIHAAAKEINRSLLEKIRCLLSNTQLDKSFWAEASVYVSHLMNCLSLTMIGDKTPLDIWSSGTAQDYSLLWVFECLTYFSIKDGKLNLQAKKFVFFGVKRNMKSYKLCDPEN